MYSLQYNHDVFSLKTEKYFMITANCSLNQSHLQCMDTFSCSGMVIRSLINEAFKIRIPKFFQTHNAQNLCIGR